MSREQVIHWLTGLGLAVAIWALGWLLRKVALGPLLKVLRRTPTRLDDILAETLRPHVQFWFLLIGVLLGARYADLGAARLAFVDKAIQVAFISSITLAISSFLARMVAGHAARWPDALPATTLTQNVLRIAVIALGVLVIVSNLGVAITPVLTALGVSSLAVALALQPTLSNLFAGVQITLARRIRVGDFVELEGGQQGYVSDITWRSTQIRELPNNLIIVPNAKVAEVIVKNYSLPENEQAALVQVGVSYGSDLMEVERVTVEVAKEVQRTVPGAIESFDPFIRYHTFGDSSVNFSVILRVKEFTDRYLVMHEFIKRLHRRYAAEGIEVPFPQRVVHMAEKGP